MIHPIMKKLLAALSAFLVIAILLYYAAPGLILESTGSLMVKAGGFHKESVEIDGYTAHYLDNRRQGKPVLVMLHGFADRKESWLPFANRLSRNYRVIIPDAMGHGDNAHLPDETYSFQRHAEFVHALAGALDLTEFHLTGISMGGGIAGKYAVLYPEDLHSLTLISSAGLEGCDNRSAMDRFMDNYPTAEEKEAHFPLLPAEFSRSSARQFKEYIFYGNFFLPMRLFRVYMERVIVEREYYQDVLDDFVDIQSGDFIDPLDDELHSITCPVLVIWGKEDPLLDVSCAAVAQRNLPTPPTTVIIDKCGHATIVEEPKQTYRAMRDFLQTRE